MITMVHNKYNTLIPYQVIMSTKTFRHFSFFSRPSRRVSHSSLKLPNWNSFNTQNIWQFFPLHPPTLPLHYHSSVDMTLNTRIHLLCLLLLIVFCLNLSTYCSFPLKSYGRFYRTLVPFFMCCLQLLSLLFTSSRVILAQTISSENIMRHITSSCLFFVTLPIVAENGRGKG